MKQSALKRKTPLKAGPPPVRTSTLAKSKPGVAAAQAAQRKAVRARSGGRCEFERWAARLRCPNRGGDTAHIFSRPKCGKARDAYEVVVDACRDCHERFDGHATGEKARRAPLRYAQAAWDEILRQAKPEGDQAERLRKHIANIGPRPTNGEGPYA